MVSSAVHLRAGELLWRGVGHRPDRHVRSCQSADLVESASYAEISQQNSLFAGLLPGEQDVGGLDVAVQQSFVVRVVQRPGHCGNDFERVLERHAPRIPVPNQLCGVGAVHVVHRNPQLAVELSAIVNGDDVWMPQSGGDVSLAVEPISEVLIRRERCGEDLDRVESRQSGVLSQINLAHPAGTEPAQNSVPGEDFSVG